MSTPAGLGNVRNQLRIPPTTDGYPDVDTYRDHEFYLETSSPARGVGNRD